jgi:hypothetical protein
MGIYQSSGHTRNPLGVVSVFVGIVGALISVVLWAYQYDPGGPFVRSVASRLGPGLALGDSMVLLAAICGGLAIAMAITGSVAGSTKGSSAIAIVFGVIALSYPVLSWFKVLSRPVLHRLNSG